MAKGRGGLGRGLESLFEDAAPSFESDTRIETLPLREIEPDPAQPRKTFDEETLAELAASISEHGLLQPFAVRPHGVDRSLIVAGERRFEVQHKPTPAELLERLRAYRGRLPADFRFDRLDAHEGRG